MKSLKRWLAAVAVVVWVLPLAGCRFSEVRVLIPDFESAGVEGIWLWKDAGAGNFEREIEIQLGEPSTQGGVEVVEYTLLDDSGQVLFQFVAPLGRIGADPDAVELDLMTILWQSPGEFKASSYNAGGESELSAQAIEL